MHHWARPKRSLPRKHVAKIWTFSIWKVGASNPFHSFWGCFMNRWLNRKKWSTMYRKSIFLPLLKREICCEPCLPDIISKCTQCTFVLSSKEEGWTEGSWFTAGREATCCKLLSGRWAGRRKAGCSLSPGETIRRNYLLLLQLFHLLCLTVYNRMAVWHTPSSLRLSLPLLGLKFQS